MSSACREFRRRLERALLGRPDRDELEALGWQEHLLACGDCRGLLEAEQVLEELLASLPNPRLSPDSMQRLVERLRALRADDAALDNLLDLDRAEPPPDLADRVLASMSERARAPAARPLDEVLDAWRVDAPAGLAERVLADLEPARGRVRSGAVLPWRRYAAAAAILVAAALAWRAFEAPITEGPGGDGTVAQNSGDPRTGDPGDDLSADEELLANLDVLEAWDVLLREDVDLLLASYDPVDEVLLDWEADSAEPTAPAATPEEPEEG